MRAWFAGLLVGCYTPTPPTGAPCANGTCPAPLVCSPATQTCEREAIDADAAPMIDMMEVTVDAGIDAQLKPFLYKRTITIQNTASVPLPTGFTIRVVLGSELASLVSASKVRADFADLRVIGPSALERDRIIDPPAGVAVPAVHFALSAPIQPGSASVDYALYYGAPNATAAPANGSAVFALYDDFNSGISSVWQKNDGPAASSGQLVLRANQTDALTTTAASDNVPLVSAMDLSATVIDPGSEPTVQTEGTFYYWFGYQRTGDFTATDPWAVWIARSKNQIQGEQKSPVGCETGCSGGAVTQNTAAHHYAIERDAGATRFYRDGVLSATVTVTNSTDYSLMLRNYMATSDLRIDWVRARALVSPAPTITLGSEESL